ncbi:HEAT repeat-containing protein [Agreia bicolorata]|uniref:HEAT repeat-containing protein n=1 Tax=Agreia bicolorata TaxID=110935 RepID=A0A1T4Y4E4_9MICO|nr:HEAT repeat domain-containing protein [Agreia bicolorata]SKA96620.1 HEAT repeat-containing protein [Agreia bicolorata]
MAHDSETPSHHTASLEERIQAAVDSEGGTSVVLRARSLLEGGYEGEDFLRVVGGPHADGILAGAPSLYWPELWGARALNYVWSDAAAPAVIAGLGNQAWRVREMCAKVAALRSIAAPEALTALTTDDHARVRSAAARALAATGDAATQDTLEALLRDPDKDVRRTAQQSLKTLKDALS